MKALVLAAAVVAFPAFAQEYSEAQDFVGAPQAPTINGKSNFDHPQSGEIIFDTSDDQFYGRTDAGAWISLSAAESMATPSSSGVVANGGSPSSLAYTDLTSQTNCNILSGDVASFKWKITDNVVTIWWAIDTMSVSAMPTFYFTLPTSVPRPAVSAFGTAAVFDSTTSYPIQVMTKMEASGILTAVKLGSGNFTASTDNSGFYGQMSWTTN